MIRLNLLPPEIKEEIEYSHKNANYYQYLVRSLAVISGIFALMFVIGFIVWNNKIVASEIRQDAATQLAKMSQVEIDAKDFYARLNLIDKIRKDKLNWNKIFTEVGNSTPSGVRLIGFNFTDINTDRIAINGFANSAADVGIYREQLSKTTIFQFVDVESVTAGTDPVDNSRAGVTFRITASFKVAEAKKK